MKKSSMKKGVVRENISWRFIKRLLYHWKKEKKFEDSRKESTSFEKEIRDLIKEKKKGKRGAYPRFLGSIPLFFNEQKEAKVQLLKKRDGSIFGVLGFSILSLGKEDAMRIFSDVQDGR